MLLTRDKSFYRTIISLAIPMVLQNLITYSVGLADNLMVGSLGDSAISGVYMGNQVQTVLQVLSAGIEGGILLISAQYWGKKDVDSIRKITSVGIWFSLLIGMIFSVVTTVAPREVISIFTDVEPVIDNGVEYLSMLCYSYVFFTLTQAMTVSMRSVESAQIGLIVSSCSLVIDITLNYIFIFGKLGFEPMGVKGAALATLIARICETLIVFTYVRFIDKKLEFRLKMLKHIDIPLFKDFLKYGTPLMLGQLVWGTNLFSNSVILGHLGESVTTAVSIANTLNNLMYVGVNGLAGAVGIVIGKKVGSGQTERIREYSNTVQICFLCLGFFTSAFFFLICRPFISLYDITPESAEYAKQFIHVLCVTAIGTCYQCPCLFGLVKSGGDVSFVFKNDTIAVFCVVIPTAIITSKLGCPAWVVFFCLKSDQIFKCIVAFFKIRKYNWMKNLTKSNV